MSYDPKKVIDIALAEEGYLEKKSNSQLDNKTANAGSNNYTKYARDMDALGFYNGKKQSVAWCDVFVDWCFVKAYGLDVALAMTFQPLGKNNSGAGCQYSRNYYKNKGRLFDKPKIGDQIFFWNSDKSRASHTGLVYAVDSTYVYTVEGNTSGASGVVSNGGGVKKKKYKLNYNRLAGYGRPMYELESKESTSAPATTTTPKSESGKVVKVTGNSVNIRTGPSTKHTIVHVANKGDKFNLPNTDGWRPIEYGGHVYWISANYSELED